MSDDVVSNLLREAAISFVGTVERIGAVTMSDVPVNDHTTVVRVSRVLDAPASLSHLVNQEVTVILASDATPVAVGQQFAFFTNTAVLGQSLAVTEVGRLPASQVQPQVAQATASTAQPLGRVRRQIQANDLRAHAGAAEGHCRRPDHSWHRRAKSAIPSTRRATGG